MGGVHSEFIGVSKYGRLYLGFKNQHENWINSFAVRGCRRLRNEYGEQFGDAEDVDFFIAKNNCDEVWFASNEVQEADSKERWGM